MEELNVVVNQTNGEITCNFEEIKEALQIKMSAYSGLEIAEDGIKDAKSDLATLRKIRKAFDDRRKEVKRDFMRPYEAFEAQAKGLLALIDEPIYLIDSQLKAFEEKRVAEKKEHLHELYEQNIGDLAEFLPYDRVAKDKWSNATYSDKDIIADISECRVEVKSDLSAIEALNSEIKDEVIAVYKRTGSLAEAVKKNSDYLAAKQLAEQKIREEQERKDREELERKIREEQKPVPEVKEEQVKEEQVVSFVVKGSENIEKARMILSLEEIPFTEV